MKYLLFLLIFMTLGANNFKNDLAYETSPYLKQHESNPIEWMSWGDEAFQRAEKENKAVFLSIGYSTCHWCHVMAKESFENETIAQLFNNYFICIKVDREEMPHLDSYYQQLHLKLKKRSGGWPLSAFLTHERKPFYVGTYIPPTKEHFHEGLDTLLPKIYKRYANDNNAVFKQALAIESIMNKDVEVIANDKANISIQTLITAIEKNNDPIYGGFGRNRKFPEASKLALMMDLALLDDNQDLQSKSLKMLDVMALRGLYDHVEGGFFRYAVDGAWEIPHFEKMLYNQAELIPLYVRAYLSTKKELYKDIVIETIAMLDNKFVNKNLYYSASDADTDHKEGAYFIFTKDEITNILEKNRYAKELREALDITIGGNFEGKIHLNFYSEVRPKGFEEFRLELLKIRQKKEYPFIDKKINTAWNAMMIEALYTASIIDEKYAKKADKHLETLLEFMFKRGELYHQSLIGVEATQLGLLEDYSFLISALLSAYQVSFDDDKLNLAEYLFNKAKEKFYKDGVWYLSDDELEIKADTRDKYYTAAIGKMTQNMIKLASLKSSFRYEKIAINTLESLNSIVEKEQSNTPSTSIAFLMQSIDIITLKSSKENLLKNVLEITTIKHPYIVKKKDSVEEYLACTMRSCFVIDLSLENVKKTIEGNIRK